MIIIIGSKNPIKILAVKNEFNIFYPNKDKKYLSFYSKSEVANQPIGIEQLSNGAINRAKYALELFNNNNKMKIKKKNEIFSVGIEAGLMPIPLSLSGYLGFNFCAIMNRNNQISLSSSSSIDLPFKVINKLINHPEFELGDIMAEITGNENIGKEDGAIGYFSKKIVTRLEVTQQAVRMALIPYYNSKEYF